MLSKLRIFFFKMFNELAFVFANIIFIISISFWENLTYKIYFEI